LEEVKLFMKNVHMELKTMDSELQLDIRITLYHGDDQVSARIIKNHTNIVLIKHNDEIIFDDIYNNETGPYGINYSLLNMKDIYEFASQSNIDELSDILSKQITYSKAISNEGLN